MRQRRERRAASKCYTSRRTEAWSLIENRYFYLFVFPRRLRRPARSRSWRPERACRHHTYAAHPHRWASRNGSPAELSSQTRDWTRSRSSWTASHAWSHHCALPRSENEFRWVEGERAAHLFVWLNVSMVIMTPWPGWEGRAKLTVRVALVSKSSRSFSRPRS
jgi:hypothetical protein